MTLQNTQLADFLEYAEKAIAESIPQIGEKSKLRDACEYALLNGGKRLRPIIVFMVAKALDQKTDVTNVALAAEYFHTASLIADDLPCMDNDDMRRGKPSLHKVYGEAVALLASYALISAGYRCIYKNAHARSDNPDNFLSGSGDEICMRALENVTYNTGIAGATGGQFLDIYPPDQTLETLRRVIRAKTVALFELSFVLGWLFGGGRIDRIEEVKRAAWHFGMAFQIADDFGDVEQDTSRGCKTNFVVVAGFEKALKVLQEELSFLKESLSGLGLLEGGFQELVSGLSKAAEEHEAKQV
ncbi:MAG: geranylgeranyl diphosphate synthase type II [Chlamydiales bacterium]|jgi:geranylgeranyl diphosphate synthase type II